MSKLSDLFPQLSKATRYIVIAFLLCSALLLFGLAWFKKSSVHLEEVKNKSSINVEDVKNSTVDINASVNVYHSADYKALQAQLEKAQQHVKNYPDDASFRQELKETQEKLDDFKRDVLKLAEDFNKIPINTERLRLAKQHFDAGEYQAARAILDAEALTQDQDTLLDKQQRLTSQQAEVTQQLTDNATEFLLKARLTAIDYSLPDRIAQTSQFFEQALKSARTPENMFDYALFLQKNNQFKATERWYQETLTSYRQLAKDNPAVYLSDVATTLNNLGLLVSDDSQRRAEAETLYKEALAIRRQLAKDNPAVYLSNVANVLNNLGNLVGDDSQRRVEAETLHKEALAIRRQLAKDNPAVYLPDVAMTLNDLGTLVGDDSQHRAEAETLYKEALSNYRQLAKDNPAVYLPYVAMTLNNLGALVVDDSQRRAEAETLYKEALDNYRQLAKDNPAVYLPAVATTLNNVGILVSVDQRRAEAETLYKEALAIRRQLVKDNPTVYLPDVADTLNTLGLCLVQAATQRRAEAETLLKEALVIRRQLAKNNPAVYLPKVENTLGSLGVAYLKWHEPKQALIYLQEAETILAPFAQQVPELFAEQHAKILRLIEQVKQQ